MALKKQTIRRNQHLTSEGRDIPKDEIIALSESWTEQQVIFFKKMLKQGGDFKVGGVKYRVVLTERDDLDSNGNKPINMPPILGEKTF